MTSVHLFSVTLFPLLTGYHFKFVSPLQGLSWPGMNGSKVTVLNATSPGRHFIVSLSVYPPLSCSSLHSEMAVQSIMSVSLGQQGWMSVLFMAAYLAHI